MIRSFSLPGPEPWVVAALDFSHAGRLSRAEQLVAGAGRARVTAVKLSLRRMTQTLAPDVLDRPWPPEPSATGSLRDWWKARELSDQAFRALARSVRRHGMGLILAPHEAADVVRGERIRPDAWQIDPPALGDERLLRAIRQTRRPVAVVAGMCTETLLASVVRALGRTPLVLLHTVSAVPLPTSATRLGLLGRLRERFGRPVGYLSLDTGLTASIAAAALGAVVIEKPLAVESDPAVLTRGAVTPEDLPALVRAVRETAEACRGHGRRTVLAEEVDALAADACSIVARRTLPKGATLKASDVALQAPLRGITGRLLHWVVGRRLLYDMKSGEPLTFGLIDFS